MLLLLLCTAQAADWFYPGPGQERLTIGDDGTIDGLPVRRTGALLVRSEDPEALLDLPAVRSARWLRSGALRLELYPGEDELALSRELHARPEVRWAHPDLAISLTPSALPDDPYLADQWHLQNTGQGGWTPGVDIDAETAWAITQGEGVIISVIDGGLDVDHPDLDGIAGYDYVDDDEDPYPDVSDGDASHGTCAAGISAAQGDNGLGVTGVAWKAQVYGIRLLGDNTTLSDVADAFVESADAGAGVINNSWGFNNGCSVYDTYEAMAEALDYAETNGRGGLGTVVVASAGNGNCDNSGDGFQAYPTVISVAASSGHDEREWYSSFGDVVDITGPSGSIVTTDLSGDYGYGTHDGDPDYMSSFSGTSASAPVVSGVVALMLAANPRLTAAQVRQVLCETAEPIDVQSEDGAFDEDGWSPWYGCGRVDAGSAVLAVANEPPLAPALLSPVEEAWEERVLLRWEATDPDGEALSYILRWEVDGVAQEVPLDEPLYELTGQVECGQTVSWSAAAIDAFGEGPPSSGSFVVSCEETAEPVAEPKGCAVVPVGGGLFLMPLVLWRRRAGQRG